MRAQLDLYSTKQAKSNKRIKRLKEVFLSIDPGQPSLENFKDLVNGLIHEFDSKNTVDVKIFPDGKERWYFI